MPSYIRTRTEFAVNSFTSENQTAPSVSTFADGGFVVTWVTTDPTQDGDSNAIKAQLFDSAGGKVGTEFLVNGVATGGQVSPSVTTFANGNFVVTWGTNTLADGTRLVEAQLFGRNGDRIGAEFQVTTGTSLFEPNVTSLADGRFIISWDDWTSQSVKGQIFDAAGAPVGNVLTLATDPAQGFGDVIALADGGFVATWRINGTSWDVKAQLFNASGAKVGGAFIVNTTLTGSQNSPDGTALADGGFVITWAESNPEYSSGNTRIKAQMFTASGTKVGGELLVSTSGAYTMGGQVVTALPDGGFIIAWHNTNLLAGGGSDSEVKAQRFSASGARVDGELQINTLTAGSQWLPDLDTLADGRVVAVWASGSGDGSGGSVRAQILGTEAAAPLPNTRPVIISDGGGTSVTLTRDEGETAVTTVVASDDGEPTSLRYSITGGADAALFTINALTGALAFIQAPDHEAPQDEGADNFYNVTVTASDGSLTGFQSIQIAIGHVNRVTIVSDGGYDHADVWMDENQTAVTMVSAMDEDGVPLTYAITGGYDAALFTIDPQTGELRFAVAPDCESPATLYGGNDYYVQVTATDGTRSDTQDIYVHVNDVEEPQGFAIVSDGGEDYAELRLPENGLAVTVVTAVGGTGPVTYEIVGGAHAGWFDIDAESGALSFRGPPDFETGIYGGYYYDPYNFPDRYEVIVRASDGVSSDEQGIIISIDDVDEAPAFGSYDGAGQVTVIVTENDVDLGYVWASDPDRYSWVTYGLDGADAAFFQIDPYSGAFSFIQAPDFEARADADGDNVYEVSVVAYSGMLSAVQSYSFRVVDLYEGVAITSNGGGDSAGLVLAENVPAVTTVAATGQGTVTYAIVGGADALYFQIDPFTGALAFAYPSDFEGTGDADSNNVYEVVVRASDGWTSDDQHLSITLTDVDEDPDFFNHEPGVIQIWAAENRASAGILNAYDLDGGPAITYAVTGGADGALFTIDPVTGDFSFLNADGPDFEAPADSDGDNLYEVEVTATAGTWSRARDFTVTVVDENEPIVITSDGGGTSAAIAMDEGQNIVTTVVGLDPDGTAPTYSIIGGADAARFTIDAATGVLSFAQTPDHEAPADEGADNFYSVTVAASDGQHQAWQTVQVLVGDVNEGVTISTGPALSVDEDSGFVARIAATDGDGDTLTYSIAGGADASHFVIDPATGDLTVRASLDFEAPADADGDNVYEVIVRASDGELSDERQMSITVNDVNDTVDITSYGGAASVALTVQEGGVFQIADVDASLSPFWGTRFAISGGADAALFTVDPISGELSFKYPFNPDFEAPGDADGDNVYDVVVTAGTATSSDSQAFAITVADRNEGLWITSDNGGDANLAVDEGGLVVTIVTAYDLDGDVPTYSIAGGADAALFAIDPVTGILRFVAAPDHEAPADSDGNNVYRVTVAASDGEYTALQNLFIAVGNVNEGVTINSNGGAAAASVPVAENGTAVTNVAATDADGGAVTYAIVGGADAARFTIDAASGALAFVAAPNFEAPADSGGDNVYDVIVSASDGSFTDTQAIAVTVGNVNEGVAINLERRRRGRFGLGRGERHGGDDGRGDGRRRRSGHLRHRRRRRLGALHHRRDDRGARLRRRAQLRGARRRRRQQCLRRHRLGERRELHRHAGDRGDGWQRQRGAGHRLERGRCYGVGRGRREQPRRDHGQCDRPRRDGGQLFDRRRRRCGTLHDQRPDRPARVRRPPRTGRPRAIPTATMSTASSSRPATARTSTCRR